MTGMFTVCLLGRIQKVLAEPALVTVVGCSARFVSGAERGDRIEIDLTVKETRVIPIPAVRNPEGVGMVGAEMKDIHPNFNEICQGAFTGQITDMKAAFKQLSELMNAELDRAISAVKGKGVDVSRDDWTFPNWDPMKNYLQSDYDALK